MPLAIKFIRRDKMYWLIGSVLLIASNVVTYKITSEKKFSHGITVGKKYNELR